MASAYIGYALLAVGIVLLIITFLLGYGVYQNATADSMIQQSSKMAGNNLTAVIGSSIQSATAPIDSGIYAIISIAVLFLFASIGYKMALLGTKVLEAADGGRKER